MAIFLLALVGSGISIYLAGYQLGRWPSVWDPLFGIGSALVLKSRFSQALPVPDALAGALAYGCEAISSLIGPSDRWQAMPRWTLGVQILVFGMALGSAGLVLIQAFLVRAWCTLCLISAVLSWLVAALSISEAQAALRQLGERNKDYAKT